MGKTASESQAAIAIPAASSPGHSANGAGPGLVGTDRLPQFRAADHATNGVAHDVGHPDDCE